MLVGTAKGRVLPKSGTQAPNTQGKKCRSNEKDALALLHTELKIAGTNHLVFVFEIEIVANHQFMASILTNLSHRV